MGVHGLWKLLESTGKPINPETLEGKILAVDISIWLNQAVKGVRDREGNNVHNAHLLTLFNRLCKLLFFRIRPVFVYDGDAPLLKKQTLAIRRQRKEEMVLESKQTHEKLLRTFLKRQAIKTALGDRSKETIPNISSVRRDEVEEMYVLPALPPVEEEEQSSSDEEPEREEVQAQESYLTFQDEMYENTSSVDINSEEFLLLSPEIKHEILKDMKEFSKRRRTLFHKPPERSGDFSQYQLAGLLQRNNLNQRLEGVEKEMNQRTCGAVEEEYVQGDEHSVESRRLLSEDSSHYILIKGSQKRTQTTESHVAPDPWSSGPWSRKGRVKGRPEPLWRPISDGVPEENEPSSSSSSSTTPKLIICTEEQPSAGAPPSPRTLQAIQAAMMDSSSDEDKSASKNKIQDGSVKTSSQEDNGGVSPRTLQAIQRALTEDNNVSEYFGKEVQTQPQKVVIVSSSDEDEDQPESTVMQKSVLNEAQEGGGLSPQTLLAIQRALGEKETLTEMEQVDRVGVLSSSEGEEMDEVVGVRSKKFRSATNEEVLEKNALKTASAPSDLQSNEKVLPEEHGPSSANNFCQKESLSISLIEEKEERNTQIIVKSEEEDSSSEESFIEVSEGEEETELNNSVTKSEEQLPERSNKEEVVGKDEEESQKEDLSGTTPSLNSSEMEEKQAESSREVAAAPPSSEWDNIDMEELVELEKDLQAEQSNLRGQQQQQQRSAATVTGQMCQESQELLRLFGVPFIVAPMEAEAQCAALDRTDQTHGTITDDSDVWLFGGRHVYKNFFNSKNYVEHYQYLDIQNQLGLDRTKMINLAYLLGSDYTEGIPGVGYVTGMEILNEFPGIGLELLNHFSKWWNEAQTNKKLVADPKDTKVKKKLRALKVHPGFPNPAVAEAYLQPTVDPSEGLFCWGHPQLDLIKEYPLFAACRFGWNSRKTEETLQPVLKQLSTQQTQLRIDSFFRLEQQEKQAIRSQRLRRAVTCLKRKERDRAESSDDETVSPVKKGKNGKEKGTDVTPAGMFGGGFIGINMSSNSPEEKMIVGETVEKRPKTPPLKSESSSSSSEDELEHKKKATMVIARSVFEGKTRGRGRRGGRGGARGK
ncbi:DNA repair protein complementing XP-G cells, partial [Silurus asotus]